MIPLKDCFNNNTFQYFPINPKSNKEYGYYINTLCDFEIKKPIGKRDFIANQTVKHLRQKLELERAFIPVLKKYFRKQTTSVRKKSPNIITIEPLLVDHYLRVARKITGRNIKQVDVNQVVNNLIKSKVKKQAGLIDETTNKDIEQAVNLAREQLANEGTMAPSQALLYSIAAKIFLNMSKGRLSGIATTETQGMYEALRAELIEAYKNEIPDIIIEKDVNKMEEIAEMTDSYTYAVIADRLKGRNVNNAELFGLVALMVKRWVTVGDSKVRAAHQEANGQTVNILMPFMVGGEMLRYPGDPMGSAKNICNCRCSVAYI